MVFFKITGYKTRPVRKKQAKRDSSVIRSIGRELRDIIFEKSQANREGAFFFVFGEYDFLLIRNRYKARRSSQLPQIDQLDYDYHTKQYIYREIINLPQRDGKKKGFSEDLQLNMQGLEHTGLLAFSQVSFRKEIDAGKKEEVLYELFERAHRKQKDAVYPLAIFEGTSWDDLGIIWYLPKNIFSMKDIFEFLEHIDREELKDRSITHLAYSSCWKPKGTSRERINGTLGLEIGGQSLYALSRVIARLNPEEERKGIEIIKSSIEEQCKVRVKVFEALGLNDYTILWELESDNSINEIEQGLSVLIARGIVRDCTTEIIML